MIVSESKSRSPWPTSSISSRRILSCFCSVFPGSATRASSWLIKPFKPHQKGWRSCQMSKPLQRACVDVREKHWVLDPISTEKIPLKEALISGCYLWSCPHEFMGTWIEIQIFVFPLKSPFYTLRGCKVGITAGSALTFVSFQFTFCCEQRQRVLCAKGTKVYTNSLKLIFI